MRASFALALLLAGSGCHAVPRSPSEGAARIVTVGQVTVAVRDGGQRNAVDRNAVDHHVATCVLAVARWFDGLPSTHLTLHLDGGDGDAVGAGEASADADDPTARGAHVRLHVPDAVDAAALARDWVLIHELVHVAMPSQAPEHHWFEEGCATYVEPLIQVAAGRLAADEVWTAMLDEYAQGLDPENPNGLDGASSWGRTYYGGAIFCLLADVQIRERTANRRSLQHALRAVSHELGGITTDAALADVLTIGDRATGTTVLQDLYDKLGGTAFVIDLEALWRELGVSRTEGGVAFDDTAPLAPIRRALLAEPASRSTAPTPH